MALNYMEIAQTVSKASKDTNTKVGAVIVSNDGRVLSCGYNGAPRKFNDRLVPTAREGNFIDTKYAYTCHAELNAILNYRGSLADFDGATIYCTLFPCNECAKALSQININKVIYLDDKHHTDDIYYVSRYILDECGVKYEQYKQ